MIQVLLYQTGGFHTTDFMDVQIKSWWFSI